MSATLHADHAELLFGARRLRISNKGHKTAEPGRMSTRKPIVPPRTTGSMRAAPRKTNQKAKTIPSTAYVAKASKMVSVTGMGRGW